MLQCMVPRVHGGSAASPAQLSAYQEESQLLDGFLEGFVTPLSTLLRQQAIALHADPAAALPRQCVLGVCRLLSVLVTVRGYKTVVKFFPHDASDLEAVLGVLLLVKSPQTGSAASAASDPMRRTAAPIGAMATDDDQGLACWEAQMMLLLWLSMLILIPFDLSTVDTEATLEQRQENRAVR